jgi:hypothetical protein
LGIYFVDGFALISMHHRERRVPRFFCHPTISSANNTHSRRHRRRQCTKRASKRIPSQPRRRQRRRSDVDAAPCSVRWVAACFRVSQMKIHLILRVFIPLQSTIYPR